MLCHAVPCFTGCDSSPWNIVRYLVVEPVPDVITAQSLSRELPHLGVLRVPLLWHASHHLALQTPQPGVISNSSWSKGQEKQFFCAMQVFQNQCCKTVRAQSVPRLVTMIEH